MITENEKLYNGLCRVAIYVPPLLKKKILIESQKYGSTSKLCNEILTQYFKNYKL